MENLIGLFASPENWIALVTLTLLEIVLGIDNIVFIAILTDRLPERQRPLAYRLGLGGAMLTRIVLLLTISWIMGLRAELFRLHFDFWRVQLDQGFSGRDIILLVGGLFLIGKSAHEIFEKVEAGVEQEEIDGATEGARRAFGKGMTWVVGQIMVMDIIFSLDSVITAVGMVNQVPIMVAAIVVAIAIMMLFAKKVGEFVNNNPSMKILALSFLLLIGVLLTADGLGQHMNKGYIYFAMAFAVAIELLNMRLRNRRRRQTPPVSGQPRSV